MMPRMLVNCVAYQNGRKLADIPVEDISEYVSRPDCFVWVALAEPTDDELDLMAEEFGLHELAVDDAKRPHQRPKRDEYGDELFAAPHTVGREPPDGPLDDTYPAPRAITIEDLMTHRSGLTAYNFMDPGPLAQASAVLGNGIDSPLSSDAWLAALAALPLAYAPGERFNYGFSIDLLGLIIGRATQMSFRQAMAERVFGPLHMHDTDFWIAPDKRERAAVPYDAGAGLGDFTPGEPSAFIGEAPQDFASGGQGLASTADDYLTFARMLVGGGGADGVRLLKPETVKLMATNRLTDAQRALGFLGMPFWAGQGQGLGMSVIIDAEKNAWMGAGSNGAFGWSGAYGGWWQGDPARDLILIWLTQAIGPAPAPGAMPRMPGMLARMDFQNRVYAALDR